MRFVVGLTILVGAGSGGWYGYQRWMQESTPPEYETAEVEKGTVVATVSATGTVEPLLKVLVGTEVSGTILKWYADFNQKVEEGFVLAELEQDRFTAVLEQRKAAVAAAQAGVEEAQARLIPLTIHRQVIERAFGEDAASELEHRISVAEEDAARAALHAAEAQLQIAEADKRRAAVDVDKTVIRSPIDGVVISRDVDEGQTVAATMNAPTLFTIANDLAKMRVNAAVSEMDIGKVRDGMQAEFRVDAYPDRRFEGVVSQVRYKETIENNVVTYTTLVLVDNPDLLLRPGMTARITFEVDRVEEVLKVPNAALRFNPNPKPTRNNGESSTNESSTNGRSKQPHVYRLEGAKLLEVPVTLGLTDGKFTAVTSEQLKIGDAVAVGRQPQLGRSKRR